MPLESVKPMALDERKIIARRCAMELRAGAIVNLGIGMPEGVAAVAAEERISEFITLTAEPGVVGGVPASGLDFGAAVNTEAIIHQNQQFDFYDGGGLDIAFLGMAEADAQGNVNVSRFGPKLAGAGGFINISQNARKVVFAGTFTAGGLDVQIEDGRLRIVQEGRVAKVPSSGSSRSPSAARSRRRRTSRCSTSPSAACSDCGRRGLELIEAAPGIDVERDILAHMRFRPIVRTCGPWTRASSAPSRWGCGSGCSTSTSPTGSPTTPSATSCSSTSRGSTSAGPRTWRRSGRPSRRGAARSAGACAVVVNYDAFRLDQEVADDYAEMVRSLEESVLHPRVPLHDERLHAGEARPGPDPHRPPAHLREQGSRHRPSTSGMTLTSAPTRLGPHRRCSIMSGQGDLAQRALRVGLGMVRR